MFNFQYSSILRVECRLVSRQHLECICYIHQLSLTIPYNPEQINRYKPCIQEYLFKLKSHQSIAQEALVL